MTRSFWVRFVGQFSIFLYDFYPFQLRDYRSDPFLFLEMRVCSTHLGRSCATASCLHRNVIHCDVTKSVIQCPSSKDSKSWSELLFKSTPCRIQLCSTTLVLYSQIKYIHAGSPDACEDDFAASTLQVDLSLLPNVA